MHREKQAECKAGRLYPAIFTRDGTKTHETMSGTVRVNENDEIIEAWDCDGFQFMWKGYHVDILK